MNYIIYLYYTIVTTILFLIFFEPFLIKKYLKLKLTKLKISLIILLNLLLFSSISFSFWYIISLWKLSNIDYFIIILIILFLILLVIIKVKKIYKENINIKIISFSLIIIIFEIIFLVLYQKGIIYNQPIDTINRINPNLHG